MQPTILKGNNIVNKNVIIVGDSISHYTYYTPENVAEKLNIKNRLWEFAKEQGTAIIGEGFIIYGEIYGAGIQKNYDYGLKDIEFAGFDFVLETSSESKFSLSEHSSSSSI